MASSRCSNVCVEGSGMVANSIDPPAAAILRVDDQPKLLPERAADGTANRVRLPPGCVRYLGDGGSAVAAQEIEDQRLFAARPRRLLAARALLPLRFLEFGFRGTACLQLRCRSGIEHKGLRVAVHATSIVALPLPLGSPVNRSSRAGTKAALR